MFTPFLIDLWANQCIGPTCQCEHLHLLSLIARSLTFLPPAGDPTRFPASVPTRSSLSRADNTSHRPARRYKNTQPSPPHATRPKALSSHQLAASLRSPTPEQVIC